MAAETQIKRCRQSNKIFDESLNELTQFVDSKLETASKSQIQLRLNDLILNYDNFKKNQTHYESLDETQFDSKIRTTVDQAYYYLRSRLDDKLSEFVKKKGTPMANTDVELSFVPKLPEIGLDKYNGDITKWRGFIESFDTHVHNNPNLNDLTRFQYLKHSVIGDASKCFESLDFTAVNYAEVRNLLIERFDRPIQIAERHIKELFMVKPIDKPTSKNLLNMLDHFNAHIRSLKSLGRPVQYWDDILIYLISSKLDANSKAKWKEASLPNVTPTFKDISHFIQVRSHKLSDFKSEGSLSPHFSKEQNAHNSQPKPFKRMAFSTMNTYSCVICNKLGHTINRCHKFISMSVDERKKAVTDHNLCTNCLRSSHLFEQCKISDVCRICKIRHHTLLHSNDITFTSSEGPKQNSQSEKQKSESSTLTSIIESTTAEPSSFVGCLIPKFVFIATALIELRAFDGHSVIARALIDKLAIKTRPSRVNIKGIACASTSSSRKATIDIHSHINNFSAKLEVQVLHKISDKQPSIRIETDAWSIPSNIKLADPSFYEPHDIDILLGADIYYKLQSIGQIRLGDELPILQNTVLGWVVAGGTSVTSQPTSNCGLVSIEAHKLDELLERFWTTEDCSTTNELLSNSECNKHFRDNFSRDDNGKFVVRLPFSQSTLLLGDSSFMARKRFVMLEKRLSNNPELQKVYNEFMREYETLNHMSPIDTIESLNFYLPHHFVLKPDSSSTKLRVVFDGSARSSNAYSLNELLMNGPVVQNELFVVFLRFRSHKYAFSADICKMYRQIIVNSNDQKYQYIFWRYNSSDAIRTYKLHTVTYGTTSAPFLATRCLLQLALDFQHSQSAASEVIRDDFYVDDLLTGSDSLEDAARLKTSVTSILQGAGFNLRKWCSNEILVLTDIPDEDRETHYLIDDKTSIKTLGMHWDPIQDHFHININLTYAMPSTVTKRSVISQVAKIFDPLGLVAPIVVIGKLLLQKLWLLKINWDESLPMAYHTYWISYLNELPKLSNLNIPRHIFNGSEKPPGIELHGFADASEKAYGAVIYVRFLNSNGYSASLLCSKSRVAPLKQITLPRLELCAAQLLAKLMQRVLSVINFTVKTCHYWTDSMIALHWIRSPSSRWKTYVANRVSDIQARSDSTKWMHVESKSNPADLISRGVFPESLMNSDLWWFGPSFLRSSFETWNSSQQQDTEPVEISEEREHVTVMTTTTIVVDDMLDRIHCKNSYLIIQNAMAYVLRFINNCRPKSPRRTGALSADESRDGLNTVIRIVQSTCYPAEYKGLSQSKFSTRDSVLKSLSIFLDENKIIRVGGRLNFIHRKNLHVGPQALLAAVRQNYWPVNGRQLAKRVYRQCVVCCRARPRLQNQLMSDLPTERVNPAPPFYNVGIDYAGPLYIHYRIRGNIPTKTYLAIFVCLATKAVHLELASDLTSASFIGAFRRFISTRGICKTVFSDNATNFVAANSELHELYVMLRASETQGHITH